MMTRRMAVLEDKLQSTLKELESSKSLCNQLLQEREDSEEEVKKIVDKNTELKAQLAEMHTHHLEILEQHEQLRLTVSNFQQCMDTHEEALRRVAELERELSEAHKTISNIEINKHSQQIANTCSLYHELVSSEPDHVCIREPVVTIDLTREDTIIMRPSFSSRNKLKRYIKITKLIKKYHKSIRKYNVHRVNFNLRKERINLVNQLSEYSRNLEHSRSVYDMETHRLREEILLRERTLNEIFNKYQASQQELSKRIVEAGELVDLVRCNAEMYESLTNKLSCSCTHALVQAEPLSTVLPENFSNNPQNSHSLQSNLNKSGLPTSINKTFIFSDRLGHNFGIVDIQISVL